eukprot:gene16889-biopygen18830
MPWRNGGPPRQASQFATVAARRWLPPPPPPPPPGGGGGPAEQLPCGPPQGEGSRAAIAPREPIPPTPRNSPRFFWGRGPRPPGRGSPPLPGGGLGVGRSLGGTLAERRDWVGAGRGASWPRLKQCSEYRA